MSDVPERLPRHVAVIMDGNGRWARARGLPRNEGHLAGQQSAHQVAECCADMQIPVLTLYALSTENYRNRPRAEVRFLMSSLRKFLRENRDGFVENNVRFRAVGALEELPRGVQEELRATEQATSACEGLTLVVAVNYGSHREIAEAARAIARKAAAGVIDPEQIDASTVEQHLYTAGLPPVDLLIRTGGQRRRRLSNFMLWQASYAELYLTETLWPDFGREEFAAAVREFAQRERLFGGLRGANAPARPQASSGTEAKGRH
ncbi:MAG: polyprenyl diphosphate synthase [Planctomycetota bacterium]